MKPSSKGPTASSTAQREDRHRTNGGDGKNKKRSGDMLQNPGSARNIYAAAYSRRVKAERARGVLSGVPTGSKQQAAAVATGRPTKNSTKQQKHNSKNNNTTKSNNNKNTSKNTPRSAVFHVGNSSLLLPCTQSC